MSVWQRQSRGLGDTPTQLIPSRSARQTGSVRITDDSALRTSAVWASLRLRADLVSTMPLQVFRQVGDLSVVVPTPPVLINPAPGWDIQAWLWATQFDLDSVGNTYGIITDRDGFGLPRQIVPVDHMQVVVIVSQSTGVVSYRINGKTYAAADVWHERQFRTAGMVMGLSPISKAAWDIAQNQSATDFALEWFANGGRIPTGHLKNTAKTVLPEEAQVVKDRWKASLATRDVFVSGLDWEFTTQNVQANESQFLETQHATEAAIARYFGVPGDLIDIQTGTKSAVTYANVTQRNLQFDIMNLGPALVRRETALSTIIPSPRFAKFDSSGLLRMDPGTRSNMITAEVVARRLTLTEARQLDDRPPYTPAQIAELKEFTPPPPPVLAIPEGEAG